MQNDSLVLGFEAMCQAKPGPWHIKGFAEDLNDSFICLSVSGLCGHTKLNGCIGDISDSLSILAGAWFHPKLDLEVAWSMGLFGRGNKANGC